MISPIRLNNNDIDFAGRLMLQEEVGRAGLCRADIWSAEKLVRAGLATVHWREGVECPPLKYYAPTPRLRMVVPPSPSLPNISRLPRPESCP